jgi:FHS family L-fucose permease-like MFS transporter
MFIGRLLGGLFGSKLSSRSMLGGMAVLAIIFVAIGMFSPATTLVRMPVLSSDLSFSLTQVPIGIMFLTLCGLCTSVMWGAIFNLAVEGLGKYTAAASGIFMVMVCGGGILPLLQGYIADIASYTVSYWVVIAGFAYILYYALLGSRNVNKTIKTE